LDKNTVLQKLILTGEYGVIAFFSIWGSCGDYGCCLLKCGFGGGLFMVVVACALLKRGYDQVAKSATRAFRHRSPLL
jgi:hypothetical protein